MKVRVTLVNGRTYAGEPITDDPGWFTVRNSKGKILSFPDHAVLMVEEI